MVVVVVVVGGDGRMGRKETHGEEEGERETRARDTYTHVQTAIIGARKNAPSDGRFLSPAMIYTLANVAF